jgi:hypothetical protein
MMGCICSLAGETRTAYRILDVEVVGQTTLKAEKKIRRKYSD